MRYFVIIFAGVLLAGCQFENAPSDASSKQSQAGVESAWSPQPTSVRIYPATRFVRQGEDAVLEARIELFDEMGDSVKGSGTFRLELRSATTSGRDGLLYTWQVKLHTVEDQRQYFDPVTRGYLLRLKIDDIAIAKRSTQLNIVYTTPEGWRHLAESRIKTNW
jgi:hypothetical protein